MSRKIERGGVAMDCHVIVSGPARRAGLRTYPRKGGTELRIGRPAIRSTARDVPVPRHHGRAMNVDAAKWCMLPVNGVLDEGRTAAAGERQKWVATGQKRRSRFASL